MILLVLKLGHVNSMLHVLHQLNQLDHVNIIKHKSSLTSHKELKKLVIQYLTGNPYVPYIIHQHGRFI